MDLLSLSPHRLPSAAAAAAAATSLPPLHRPTTTLLPLSRRKIKSSLSSDRPPKYSAVDYSVRLASAPQATAVATRATEADAMGLLFRERIVFLGNEIDDFVADAIITQLMVLDCQDHIKDIRLFINSPGGSYSATMAILDAVRLVRADVSTVAMGISASTASIILGGGTKGKRYAMPNARIMMHQPLGAASGPVIDVEVQAREVSHHKNNVIRLISEFTGRPLEEVEKDIDRDRYMAPMEAVEYGLIDGVIDRDTIISLVPVPERVKTSMFEEVSEDPKNSSRPDIPNDEIY